MAFSGLSLKYYSANLELSFENVDLNGNVISKSILKPHYFESIGNLSSNFLLTLSISIFISMFILQKIEKSEKKRAADQLNEIRKKINEDVFNTLFQTLVPNEIYDVIKNEIIKCQLVRKNAVWVYDFKPLTNGCFELKQTLKSELHNVSNKTYKEKYPVSFRTSSDMTESKLERFLCEYKGKQVADLNSKGLKFDQSGSHDILLDIPPNEHADITLIFKTKFRGTEIADTYYSSHAIINATLIARYPKGYKFKIFNSFSSAMRETAADEDSAIFELKGAILPGQGMTYSLLKDSQQKSSYQGV